MFNKVIIYGHKLHSHTHSYIHQAFYKAFMRMGYDTYWLDEKDDLKSHDFSNCLFLTEGQVINNIPVRNDCKYLLHYVEEEKVNLLGINKDNVLNFKFFTNEAKKYEKINDYSYYQNDEKTLSIPWAATLFPDQINKCSEKLFNPHETNVNFIGSIWDVNKNYIELFQKSCKKNNKKFIWKRLLNDKEYYYYTAKSYVTVDFRGKVHLDIGYLPCRIFKSLSFGIIPGTNSKFVKEAFGDFVYYNNDVDKLLEGTAELWGSKTKKEIRQAMDFVKDKHTYLNRIEDMLGVLREL